jgi:methylthioribose-1-phosphate isomerase
VGPQQTAPESSPVYNPAFDVTPAALITAIITERGVFRPEYHFGSPETASHRAGARRVPAEPGRSSTTR